MVELAATLSVVGLYSGGVDLAVSALLFAAPSATPSIHICLGIEDYVDQTVRFGKSHCLGYACHAFHFFGHGFVVQRGYFNQRWMVLREACE